MPRQSQCDLLCLCLCKHFQACVVIKKNREQDINIDNGAENNNNDCKSVGCKIKISVDMIDEDNEDDNEDNYVLRTTSTRL